MSIESTIKRLYKKGIAESFPLHITGYVLIAEALLMAICAFIFGLTDDNLSIWVITSLVGIILGLTLLRCFDTPRKISAPTGAFSVNLLWAVAIVYGCVPYLIYGFTPSEALFESISGFTTTGMSIVTDVASLPNALLVWRATTGWAGGLGFIIMFCLLLKYFGLDGRNIFVSSGLKKTASHSTKAIKDLSIKFIAVYAILTGMLAILLSVLGNDIVDSICISMSTISTTGFSTLNGDLVELPMISKIFIGVFLMLSAMNFMSLFSAMTGFKLKPILKDPEIKHMFIWFAVSSLTLIIILQHSEDMSWAISDFIDTILMVISIGTTTGFVFHNFSWPTVAMIFLSMIALIGGCRESPTGGIKVARLTLVFKSMKNSISTVGFPNEIRSVKFGDRYVDSSICFAALTSVIVFMMTAVIGTVVISLTSVDILDSFYLCISSLTTTGTGLYSVANVADIPEFAKGVMCALMWLGRMEVTLALVLFTTTFWKDARILLKNAFRTMVERFKRT